MSPPPIDGSSHGGRVARSTYLVLVLLLTMSAGLNVLLARRMRNLAGAIAESSRPPLQVGASVPPITAKGLDGQSNKIEYSGSDRLTVLYVFTPQCGWCARNLDNLQALLKAKGVENRFIGLSLSDVGLTDYVHAHELSMPVFTGLSGDTIRAYRFGGTPQTIVISPAGRVVHNWNGAWVSKQKAEIEAFFHVSLPGLRPAPKHVDPT